MFPASNIHLYGDMVREPFYSTPTQTAAMLSAQMQACQMQASQVMDATLAYSMPAMGSPGAVSPHIPHTLTSLAMNGTIPLVHQPPPSAPLDMSMLLPRTPPNMQAQMHSTIFFAGVNPIVGPETILALFSQFGRVMDINLFRPFPGCRTSKGCGLVVFSSRQEAAAAMDALHGKFIWPGAHSAMVIEWCDPSKQHKKARAQPLGHTFLQRVVGGQSARAISLLPAAAPMMHTHLPRAAAYHLAMR